MFSVILQFDFLAELSKRLTHYTLWPLEALLHSDSTISIGTSEDTAVEDEDCGKCSFVQSVATG